MLPQPHEASSLPAGPISQRRLRKLPTRDFYCPWCNPPIQIRTPPNNCASGQISPVYGLERGRFFGLSRLETLTVGPAPPNSLLANRWSPVGLHCLFAGSRPCFHPTKRPPRPISPSHCGRKAPINDRPSKHCHRPESVWVGDVAGEYKLLLWSGPIQTPVCGHCQHPGRTRAPGDWLQDPRTLYRCPPHGRRSRAPIKETAPKNAAPENLWRVLSPHVYGQERGNPAPFDLWPQSLQP